MGAPRARSGPRSATTCASGASTSRAAARTSSHDETLFAYLAASSRACTRAAPQLPFDLNGGFVGYLGYELKADCGGRPTRTAPSCPTRSCCSPTGSSRSTTSAARRTCSRSRRDGRATMRRRASAGCATTRARARATARAAPSPPAGATPSGPARCAFELAARPRALHGERRGLQARCSRPARATRSASPTGVAAGAVADTFALYRVLRRVNPAPYARLPADARGRAAELLAGALPARRAATARSRRKPIKGTAPRAARPRPRTRAPRDDLLRERRRTAPSTS